MPKTLSVSVPNMKEETLSLYLAQARRHLLLYFGS